MKDVFGFAEHQQIDTIGQDSKFTLKRSGDDVVLCQKTVTMNRKLDTKNVSLFLIHCNLSPTQQKVSNEHKKTENHLQYRILIDPLLLKSYNNRSSEISKKGWVKEQICQFTFYCISAEKE